MTDKVMLPVPGWQFIVDGIPLAGGKVFIYEDGTTTKAETWTDESGLTPNQNPAILDADGRGNFWVPPALPVVVPIIPPGPPGPQGHEGPPGPPGPSGTAAQFQNTIDIASETIYTAFFGSFIEILGAVPIIGGNVSLPDMIVLTYKYATTPYAMNGANFHISWGPPLAPSLLISFSAAVLEGVTDTIVIRTPFSGGYSLSTADAYGKNLTITLSAAPDGAKVISITGISDGGGGYVNTDTGTIDTGDGNATYEVTGETAGVVDTVNLTFGGTGYADATAVTTTPTSGGGSGLKLDIATSLLTAGTLRITTRYGRITAQ